VEGVAGPGEGPLKDQEVEGVADPLKDQEAEVEVLQRRQMLFIFQSPTNRIKNTWFKLETKQFTLEQQV
jgi:hypothetical protein